jgi:hypothetical protein
MQRDMRAHPIRQPMMDRPDLQIDGFDAAERPFDIPYKMPLIT